MQYEVASLLTVAAEASEVWVSGMTFELDGNKGRGITQEAETASVYVEGVATLLIS
jgi:hypothetical protein